MHGHTQGETQLRPPLHLALQYILGCMHGASWEWGVRRHACGLDTWCAADRPPLVLTLCVLCLNRASFDGKHPMRIAKGSSVHFETSLCPLPLINIGVLDVVRHAECIHKHAAAWVHCAARQYRDMCVLVQAPRHTSVPPV